MKDQDKTKEQLINELEELRKRISGREAVDNKGKQVEKKFRESKNFLEKVLDTTTDGIMINDEKGQIISVNTALEKISGRSRKDLLGEHCSMLIPREHVHRKMIKEKMIEMLERGTASYESFYNFPDGRRMEVEWKNSMIKDYSGNYMGGVSIVRDITERKQAEEKIGETKDYLNNIIESSLDCIVVCDANGYVNRVNKAFLKMLGYKEGEVIGKHIVELSPTKEGTYESTIGGLLQINEDFFSDTKMTMSKLVKEGKVSNWESYYLRKDKKVIPVEQNIVYLRSREGDVTGSVGIIRDITERRKTENEIKETRDFIESVIESSRDGIVIVDKQGYITSANSALEKMTRFKRGELVGKHISTLTIEDRDSRKKVLRKIEELYKKGFASYETMQKTKDGKIIYTECNLSMIKDDKGNYIAGVSIIRDITKRKKIEQQLIQSEKLKSLEELAGGVAHNFNNILATILGRAQLLKMNIETPLEIQENEKLVITLLKGLETIEKASLNGAELVRRVNDFSRRGLDDNRSFAKVDINEVINNVLNFTKLKWKDEAEAKGIKINVKKSYSPLPLIVGNAAELREVFTNFINNASDALPQGGEIKIKTFKENNDICIKIGDNGIGIPKTLKDRIFDPFFTTKGVKSSGLGLSVSYGIINNHRGTIMVDSIEGKGTTFTIKIPITGKMVVEKGARSMPGEQSKASILVIEDDKEVCELLSDILTDSGYKVETASDGNKGIKLFVNKDFDLVLTDLGMPGMSGWQVAEEIKKIDKKIPVILITGWEVKLEDSELKKRGVDLIVNKPFKVDQVLDLLQKVMASSDRFRAA